MIDIIKTFCEMIIDTTVITLLGIVCILLFACAFLFFPFKSIKVWFSTQIYKIADTMEYYLKKTTTER